MKNQQVEKKKIFAIVVKPSIVKEFDSIAGNYKRSGFIEKSMVDFIKKRKKAFSQKPTTLSSQRKGVFLNV